ncbi:MAG TPA: hypothetical protein VL992_11720 [Tepidisphaeraceae bacterium]|nr:hypothetical protein [Tepidisphaeraceae bacterium]
MSNTWDPITAAHQAIFAAFENFSPLTALVPVGNFIDTTNPQFQQFKPDATAADTPELTVLQDQFTLPPFGGNSTTVQFSQSYRVLLRTDTLQIVPLNQLKYQALAALVSAGPTLGLACIKSFDVLPGKDSAESQQSQRWIAVFTINVHLYLPRQQVAGS